jgi:uncharacterized iron-regulated membrane protein
MLLLCLTGLPLIFGHEIHHWLGDEVEAPLMAANTPYASFDAVLASAKALYPERVPQYMFREEDEQNSWTVSLGKTAASEEDTKYVTVDARTSEVLQQPVFDQGFMYVMYKLHVDLFAGLPGMLFLGGMGLFLVIAIISGVVLYAPFMRKLDFGEIRRNRSPKLKRLDVHNLLGIAVLIWALVVSVTGVINTWADLVVKYWQLDQMSEMTASYKNLPLPEQFGSLQAAVDVAKSVEPDMQLAFIAFPGTGFSSPHHYGVFMRGNTPITERLLKPVLIDAKTSKFSDSRDLPWYLVALLVSQPLHFGDYGGLPLKVIWLILDIITIIVLWTGLMLWWKKRKQYLPDVQARISMSEAY